MYPHTKFGIPTSKNLGDMHWTRSGTEGRTDGRTDRRTDEMLHILAGCTIQVANLVNYNCHPQEHGNKSTYPLINSVLWFNCFQTFSNSDIFPENFVIHSISVWIIQTVNKQNTITSISISKKLAIFQHLTKVGCWLLTESAEAI